jgi:hypothetical protein
LPVHQHGAQRASSSRPIRLTVLGLALALVAFGGLAASPTPVAAAAGMKVVVIVGPAGSSTSKYITSAKRYASQARSYGANVVEIYSPNATWTRVKAAARGANVLIYLGHGNGYPSPYGPFSALSKDGLGLNSSAGHGHYNVKYWGEYYVRTYLKLAPNAVVILNRLCYASGNSEWGAKNPTKAVAIKRADNFAAGFLRANARAVFAEGINSASYVLYGIFKTRRTMAEIFKSAPSYSGAYDFQFKSARSPGYTAWLDPYAPTRYYRSVIGKLSLSAATVRAN